MTGPEAKIIADSISPEGVRLTTFQVTCHRFVLAEFNTHRTLSRNSASSRAIPLRKQLQKIADGPATPLSFPAERKGMQGGDELEGSDRILAESDWRTAAENAMVIAHKMGQRGVHKSVANRLLEPFMWHTIVCTATAWENFFEQRCSPLAQPEIKAIADLMNEAYVESDPRELAEGKWHLPYIDDEDLDQFFQPTGEDGIRTMDWRKVSAARCARVSYLTQEGKRDIEEDLRLYERLTEANPPHWSPLEHVATPWEWNRQEGCIHFGQDQDSDEDTSTCLPLDHLPLTGNLLGWRSLRTEVEAQKGAVTYR